MARRGAGGGDPIQLTHLFGICDPAGIRYAPGQAPGPSKPARCHPASQGEPASILGQRQNEPRPSRRGQQREQIMRIAVVSDVHANLPALRAVLGDITAAAPDAVVSCGDLAAGPLPGPTIDMLRGLDIPVYCVRGNADRGMIETFDGTADPAATHEDDIWAGTQLTRDERDYLATFAARHTFDVDDLGPVLFCHATPRGDEEIILATSGQDHLDAALAGVHEPTVICGHTHMQFDRQAGRYRLVNVGSVGMPYGQPGAYWVLLGPGVSLRRTNYDLQAAAGEIRQTSRWHKAESFAAEHVLQPPSADDALAAFQRLENHAAT